MKTFLFIILCLFVFIIIFDKATSAYKNEYPLILCFGKKGCGKSTYLTKLALQYIKKGYTVYSTEKIAGTIFFNPKLIGQFNFPPESLVLIDEASTVFNNRDWKNFGLDKIAWFKLQRHNRVTIFMFSQVYNDIDLTLRNLVDELWLCKKYFRVFAVRRRIIKRITVGSAGSTDQQGNQTSGIVEDYKFDSILYGSFKFTFIPRYVGFFDSFTLPDKQDFSGKPIPFTDEQKNLMSDRYYIKSLFKTFLGSLKAHFAFKDQKKVKGGSRLPKALLRRRNKNEKAGR